MAHQPAQERDASTRNGFTSIGIGLFAALAASSLVASRPWPVSVTIAVLLFALTVVLVVVKPF